MSGATEVEFDLDGNYNEQGLTICDGDEDWFRIPVDGGQILAVELSFSNQSGDLEIELIDEDGATVAASTSQSDNEQIRYTVYHTTTYFLRVYGDSSHTRNSYNLFATLNGQGCDRDPLEPNDSTADAHQIQHDETYEDMTVCVGESDWYQFEVANGQLINVDLTFNASDSDLGMVLYNMQETGNLVWLRSSDNLYSDEYISYRAFTSGTYYLHVYRSRGTLNAEYSMNIEIEGSECVLDELEPNDSYVDAAEIDLRTVYWNLSLCVGKADWYSLDLHNGEVLNASISFTHEENDLALVLYQLNEDNSITYRYQSNTLSDDESIIYRPFEDGTYLLLVNRSRGTQVAEYSMEVSVEGNACEEDDFEPNNSYPEASEFVIGIGTCSSDSDCDASQLCRDNRCVADLTLCVGDADWYSFEAENGQLIEAVVGFTHSDNDLGLRLYRQEGDGTITYIMGSDTQTDNETILYRPYENATYLVYVYRSRGTQVANYALSITLGDEGCEDDSFEPNNSYTEASSVATDELHSLLTSCVGDADWYSFEAGNGQLINATITFTHEDNDMGIRLYRMEEDGTVISLTSSNTLTDNETIIYRPYEDGTYLLYAFRSRGTQVATYSMQITLGDESCEDDEFEPNNAYPEAQSIVTNSVYSGLTSCVGDADWYSFEAGNGQLITANLTFTHSDNDMGMRLYRLEEDSTITHMTGSDTLTDNETIVYRPYEDATYLIYVYRTRGTQVGNYALGVNLGENSCEPDEFEPNNAYSEAQEINHDTDYTDLTSCVGDTDWYSFDAGNGQLITATLDFVHNDNDLGMRLYRWEDDGTSVYMTGSDTLTNNETIIYRPYESGTYLLNVYRTRGTQMATYSLRLDLDNNSCDDDEFEPNNAYPEATQIEPSTVYENLTSCVGDADWYFFEAGNGQLISATIQFVHEDNDLGMNLYRQEEDGTITSMTGSNTLTDDENILYRPYEASTYLLYVYRTRGTQVAEYSLSLDLGEDSCDPDQFEPNNAYPEAQPIEINTSYSNMTSCVGDTDWYSFPVANGQLIEATIAFVHEDNDMGVRLYRLEEDGTVTSMTGADTLTDNERIIYRPYEGATYLLNVYRTRGTQVASYSMEVAISGDACEPDPMEPNDSFYEALEAEYLEPGEYEDLTICVGETDWYAFEMDNGEQLSARIDFDENIDLGMNLYRLSEDGTYYISQGGSNAIERNYEIIVFRAIIGGTYLLYTYRTRGTQVANYSMSVDIAGDGCVMDEYEDNNHYLNATPVEPGEYTGLSQCNGDLDYYSLDLVTGQTITVQADATPSDGGLEIRFYALREDNTLEHFVSAITENPVENIVYTAARDSTYIIYISRESGYYVVPDYTMNIEVN